MTTPNQTAAPETPAETAARLRVAIRRAKPASVEIIRANYYAAAIALRKLIDELELADLQTGQPGGVLIEEHLRICEAFAIINHSQLGAVV